MQAPEPFGWSFGGFFDGDPSLDTVGLGLPSLLTAPLEVEPSEPIVPSVDEPLGAPDALSDASGLMTASAVPVPVVLVTIPTLGPFPTILQL